MQFAGQSSRTSAKSKYGDAPAARTLLSMYKGAVNHEITIGDFEIWALGRLRGVSDSVPRPHWLLPSPKFLPSCMLV